LKSAATASAMVVFKNAENPELINRAAIYLKREIKSLYGIPVLKTKPSGLRVVLVTGVVANNLATGASDLPIGSLGWA